MAECPEYPQNIGDIYRVFGYMALPYRYGVVLRDMEERWDLESKYRRDTPGDGKHWIWVIEMDDGDTYAWPHGMSKEDFVADMLADDLEVVRRNPLPKEQDELAFTRLVKLEVAERNARKFGL